jgi:SAM-dependent methyltransferase
MAQSLTHSLLINKCLISGDPILKILEFGQHPYADTFINENQLNLSEPLFPLQVFLNPETGSVQLAYLSNAEDRYNLYSYSYTSSNSSFSRNHWDKYASAMIDRFNPKGLVVEIGSNDGYLISKFREKSLSTLGIDSSASMCELARDNGQPSLQAVFTQSVAKEVREKHGSACLVMANNVFNHANNPVDFAMGVRDLLSDDGVFVFELPYWADSISSGHLDQVYHEHISYFTVKSSWYLLAASGMQMIDFDIVNYHGGSLRVFAKKRVAAEMNSKIQSAIEKETASGLFSVEFYKEFQKKIIEHKNKWLQRFYNLLVEEPDAIIIGVGAAAKANTWLNWYGINGSHLKCITDSSQFKQGKFTPHSRIPILGDEVFANYKNPKLEY